MDVQELKEKINEELKKKSTKILLLSIGIVIVGVIGLCIYSGIQKAKRSAIFDGYDRVYTEEEIASYMEQGLVREIQPKEEPVVEEEPIVVEEPVEEIKEVSLLPLIENAIWYNGSLTEVSINDEGEEIEEEIAFDFINTETYKKWDIHKSCDDGYASLKELAEDEVAVGAMSVWNELEEDMRFFNDKKNAYELLYGESNEDTDEEYIQKLEENNVFDPRKNFDIQKVFDAFVKTETETVENKEVVTTTEFIPYSVEWSKTDVETLTVSYMDENGSVAFILVTDKDCINLQDIIFIDLEGNVSKLNEVKTEETE